MSSKRLFGTMKKDMLARYPVCRTKVSFDGRGEGQEERKRETGLTLTRPNRNSNRVHAESGDRSLRILLALRRLLESMVVEDPHASTDPVKSMESESRPDPALLLRSMDH